MQKPMVLLKHIKVDKRLNYIPQRWILINACWPTAAYPHEELQHRDGGERGGVEAAARESGHAKGTITHLQLQKCEMVFGMQLGFKRRPAGESADRLTVTAAQVH